MRGVRAGPHFALDAMMAAFAAVDADRLATTTAAVAFYTVAAENSTGPGSFTVAFLDALATVEPATVAERARIAVR